MAFQPFANAFDRELDRILVELEQLLSQLDDGEYERFFGLEPRPWNSPANLPSLETPPSTSPLPERHPYSEDEWAPFYSPTLPAKEEDTVDYSGSINLKTRTLTHLAPPSLNRNTRTIQANHRPNDGISNRTPIQIIIISCALRFSTHLHTSICSRLHSHPHILTHTHTRMRSDITPTMRPRYFLLYIVVTITIRVSIN